MNRKLVRPSSTLPKHCVLFLFHLIADGDFRVLKMTFTSVFTNERFFFFLTFFLSLSLCVARTNRFNVSRKHIITTILCTLIIKEKKKLKIHLRLIIAKLLLQSEQHKKSISISLISAVCAVVVAAAGFCFCSSETKTGTLIFWVDICA